MYFIDNENILRNNQTIHLYSEIRFSLSIQMVSDYTKLVSIIMLILL